jgi:hypothetical protein
LLYFYAVELANAQRPATLVGGAFPIVLFCGRSVDDV